MGGWDSKHAELIAIEEVLEVRIAGRKKDVGLGLDCGVGAWGELTSWHRDLVGLM